MIFKNSSIHQNDQSIDWEYGPSLITNDHKLMDPTNNLHFGIGQTTNNHSSDCTCVGNLLD